MFRGHALPLVLVSLGLTLGCSSTSVTDGASAPTVTVDEAEGLLTATVGAKGGLVESALSPGFAGFALTIPEGALGSDATIRVRLVDDETPLPEDAYRVGRQFQIEAGGATLSRPMSVRLPVNARMRNSLGGNAEDVKVWVREGAGWKLVEAKSTQASLVTIETSSFTTMAAGVKLQFTIDTNRICGAAGAPSCAPTQIFDAPVGRAPQPCTVAGGYCIEPLIGGAGNPAPETDRFGILVANGFLTYKAKSDARGIQIHLSDLALSHSAVAPDVQGFRTSAHLPNGAIFSGQRLHRFVGATNDPIQPTNLFVSGDPLGQEWTAINPTTARAFSGSSFRDVTTNNVRTPAKTFASNNLVALLADEVGSNGAYWFAESLVPSGQLGNGVQAGALRRLGADGTTLTTIADTNPPSLLLNDLGGGGSGGSPGGITVGTIFYANARRLVVSGFSSSNGPLQLLSADLTKPTPTLVPLAIPNPMPGVAGATFRSVLVDSADHVWFVFGATFGMGLYDFDPATGTTKAVALPGFGAKTIGLDGKHVIVLADPANGGSTGRNILRVRPFEN
jgi:hypothetical protein